MKIKTTLILLLIILISCTDKQIVKKERSRRDVSDERRGSTLNISAPVPVKMNAVKRLHDTYLSDDYAWMRDDSRKDRAVMDHIRSENQYFAAEMAQMRDIEDNLFNEIIPRIDVTDMSVPVKVGDYYYYAKNIKEGQYPVQCRKYKDLEADEEIILDQNSLAKGYEYFEMSVFTLSPDHRYLAYSFDNSGDENYTLHIKDLNTGELFPEVMQNVSDVIWAETGNTFFYSTVNETGRTDAVYCHILGTDVDTDRSMYMETDESYFVWLQKTKDKKFILMGTANNKTSEMYFLKSSEPTGFFELITKREDGVEYYVEHNGKEFYILTNSDGAYNFKIMKTNDKLPYRNNWKEFIGHDADSYIDDFELFKDNMVLNMIRSGKKIISLIDYQTKKSTEIKFNEECYTVYLGENHEFDTDIIRYHYESPVTPYTVIDYNMKTGEKTILKEQKVIGGYNKSEYGVKMVYAPSHDNKKIPVTLVFKKSLLKKDGSNPMYLLGYGAYGTFYDQDFSISRISLLDRGVIQAIAHVRGGIENGKIWHTEGMLKNKKNSFKDFISCAEYLTENEYTSTDRLVISGASAGGLLIAAVLNERPDICKAAVLDVPFVDVINTMSDPSLLAVVSEYDEWGNPSIKEDFEYMMSYCPYQNIKKQPYPEIFVRAGLYDPRVNYWEPLKWVSKIRDNNTADTKVLLSVGMTGHSGYSGKFDLYREIAETYSFILYHMGIKL